MSRLWLHLLAHCLWLERLQHTFIDCTQEGSHPPNDLWNRCYYHSHFPDAKVRIEPWGATSQSDTSGNSRAKIWSQAVGAPEVVCLIPTPDGLPTSDPGHTAELVCGGRGVTLAEMTKDDFPMQRASPDQCGFRQWSELWNVPRNRLLGWDATWEPRNSHRHWAKAHL